MTVNERLVVAGVIDRFDEAVRRGDRAAMLAILKEVELDDKQATETTDAVLAHPTRYGILR